MDANQIARFFRYSSTFKGVFPKDILPQRNTSKSSGRSGYILNTDISNQPGKHWVALFVDKNTIYYFDSYGGDPFKDVYLSRFIELVGNRRKKVYKNNRRVQQLTSPVCGYYAIAFILYMEKKASYHTFLSLFNKSYSYNDSLVTRLALELSKTVIRK